MTTPYPILLVEDEPHIAEGLIFNLSAEGYRVCHVTDGETALQHLETDHYALMVLDLMLPGIYGLEVCHRLRQQGDQIPILMLTARSEEQDRIAGLSMGADDYLAKPFSLKEFLLRVNAMLRRSSWSAQGSPADNGTYRFGTNSVQLTNSSATTSDGTVTLTELEVRMLDLFFTQEGQVLSRGQLLQTVWGMAPDTETRTLDNFIVRLRKYFEDDPAHPRHFLTVRGRGYRFVKTPPAT
ncbi:MAG: DNA-binding response regulator [Desulfuromonas sp.]|nr:MAG: DNA-binding response regulator [Desulfuromonas sp.]